MRICLSTCPLQLSTYQPELKIYVNLSATFNAGLSEPGGLWHLQILTDQLTLTQPEGADYAHLITATPRPPLRIFRPSDSPAMHMRCAVLTYPLFQ